MLYRDRNGLNRLQSAFKVPRFSRNVGDIHVESGCNALDGAPSGVGVAALDQGEGAGRDVGGVGEVFLGSALFFA